MRVSNATRARSQRAKDAWARRHEMLAKQERSRKRGARGVTPERVAAVAPVAVADGGGLRYSTGKPRFDLIPPEALALLADTLTKGAEKYAARNWERGMDRGEVIRGILSHTAQIMAGADYDVEGFDHAGALLWNVVAYIVYRDRKIGTDSRGPALAADHPFWAMLNPPKEA